MIIRNYLKIATIAFSVLLVAGCGGNNNVSDETEDTVKVEQAVKKAQKILFSLPSPIEMAKLLKESGSNYNKDILNPVEQASKYSNNMKKALNLGIFGADLAYTAMYNQTQESVFYMAATKKLADGLGITSVTEKTASRMESNLENHDSVLTIVSDSYYETDAFLKENDRAGTSALIIAGGWIEGLHLAVKSAQVSKKNDALLQRIADEKLTLNNMLGLLDSYPGDENVTMVKTELNKLKAVYDKLPESSDPVITTDTVSKVTTIGGDAKITMTPEQFKEVAQTVEAIRDSFVKP